MSDSKNWSKGAEPPSYSSHMSGFAPPAESHFSQPGAMNPAFNANYSGQMGQMAPPILRSEPVRLTCPHCRSDIITKVSYETGLLSHLAAAVLCILGCWCCFYIPYLADGMKNTVHDCPHCGRCIGVFKRI